MFQRLQISRLPVAVPITASALVHASWIILVVPATARVVNPGELPVLNALMMYAPDRQPSAPRVERLPILAPLGDLLGDISPRHQLKGVDEQLDAAAVVRPVGGKPREGMPPLGPLSVQLDSVYSVLSVDSAVIRDQGSVAPIYPPHLLRANVEGMVEVIFVVDTTGRVDPASVEVVSSSDTAFTTSVRTALAEMHFRPAWRMLHRVRQRVQQRFRFRIDLPVPPPES